MHKAQNQVFEFMQKGGQLKEPVTFELLKKRINWMLEELLEYAHGCGFSVKVDGKLLQSVEIEDHHSDEPCLAERVDALCDLIYFAYGTAILENIDIEPCFDEVHRSNMDKFQNG